MKRRKKNFGKSIAAPLIFMAAVTLTTRLYDGHANLSSKTRSLLSDPDKVSTILEVGLFGRNWKDELSKYFRTDEPEKAENKTEISLTPQISSPQPIESIPFITPEPEVIELPRESSGIDIKNWTDYDPDIDALLQRKLDIPVSADEVSVLIIHTHGTESYLPDGSYIESDPYRTLNNKHNMIYLGDILTDYLNAHGINTLHDRNFYDYPEYNGAYGRSLEAMEKHLEAHPTISVIIDLHRDAISDDDGTQYKTVAQIGDETCSQVLLVVGTDTTGLEHPNWQDNLAFALNLQSVMIEKYPSLAKPITLSQNRYNQHLTPASLIVEVGCTGNTLEESEIALNYFADVLFQVLG